jgi:hypothetical protein
MNIGRVCEGGPRARLRSWAASFRVCGIGPRGGLALGSQNFPLHLALWKRRKSSFLPSRARGGARGRFRATAGWLARALSGRETFVRARWPPRAKRKAADFACLY